MNITTDLLLLTDFGQESPHAPLIPTTQMGIYLRNGNLYQRLGNGAEVLVGAGEVLALIGQPNGIASLDGTGKVPPSQLPAGGPGSAEWGLITGSLADQTDLLGTANSFTGYDADGVLFAIPGWQYNPDSYHNYGMQVNNSVDLAPDSGSGNYYPINAIGVAFRPTASTVNQNPIVFSPSAAIDPDATAFDINQVHLIDSYNSFTGSGRLGNFGMLNFFFDVNGAGTVGSSTLAGLAYAFRTGTSSEGLTAFTANMTHDDGSAIIGSNGITGVNINGDVHPDIGTNGAGGFNGVDVGMNLYGKSAYYTGFGSFTNFRSGYNNTGGTTVFNDGNHLEAGGTMQYYQSFASTPNLDGTVTGNYTGVQVSPNSSQYIENANGIQVYMNNLVRGPNQFATLTTNGGRVQFQSEFDTEFNITQGVYGLNNIGGDFHVAAGHPINDGSFGIGNNLGITCIIEDDVMPDSSGIGLGFVMNGFLTQVAVATGKTMDSLTFMGAGASVPQGTGGNITSVAMFRAIGLLPQGGDVNITSIYGFKVDALLSAMSPTNTWGFYCADANAHNWFSKNVVVGGTSGLPSNDDVGLEIQGAKAFKLPSLTTTQKLALSALEGFFVYDSTLKRPSFFNGTSWITL